ncbi:hypothetical protein [Microbacterium sp. NPDC056234]|uniref:hypothetical protein n=1 Tax=Microbacterium sp. NPDC056234 TaxID=3345757 RepID=UPI0035D90A65
MTLPRPRRAVHRTALTFGAALVILGASGCTAVGSAETDSARAESTRVTETPSPSNEPPSSESTAAADEITCAAYGDVVTILHNAQTAYFEERMTQQELDGWFAVASRVLGNIPSADTGTVSESLVALQEAVPAVADLRKTNFPFPDGEVDVPGVSLSEACREAGFEVVINAFTGG